MLTMPIFLFVLILVGFGIKWKALSWGQTLLGALLGLLMASTAFGPPVVDGITSVTAAAVEGVSGALNGEPGPGTQQAPGAVPAKPQARG